MADPQIPDRNLPDHPSTFRGQRREPKALEEDFPDNYGISAEEDEKEDLERESKAVTRSREQESESGGRGRALRISRKRTIRQRDHEQMLYREEEETKMFEAMRPSRRLEPIIEIPPNSQPGASMRPIVKIQNQGRILRCSSQSQELKKAVGIPCFICKASLEEAKQASVSGCSHVFCFECIYNWAKKEENACPNCKARFNQISTQTPAGDRVSVEAPKKLPIRSDQKCEYCSNKKSNTIFLGCSICASQFAHRGCIPFGEDRFDHYHCSACQAKRDDGECEDCQDRQSEADNSSDQEGPLSQMMAETSRLAKLNSIFDQPPDPQRSSKVFTLSERTSNSRAQLGHIVESFLNRSNIQFSKDVITRVSGTLKVEYVPRTERSSHRSQERQRDQEDQRGSRQNLEEQARQTSFSGSYRRRRRPQRRRRGRSALPRGGDLSTRHPASSTNQPRSSSVS